MNPSNTPRENARPARRRAWAAARATSGRRTVRGAGQHRPEIANVLFHRLRRIRLETSAHRPWQLEAAFDEGPQVELCPAACGVVTRDDIGGSDERPGVGERLGVREDPRQLDVLVQRAQIVRRVVALGALARRSTAEQRDQRKECPQAKMVHKLRAARRAGWTTPRSPATPTGPLASRRAHRVAAFRR